MAIKKLRDVSAILAFTFVIIFFGQQFIVANQTPDWLKKWYEPVSLFTGLLFVVGAIQTFWVYRTVADNTSLQRAFIFPKGIRPLWHCNPATQKYSWSFHTIWENNGNTPTLQLFSNVNSYFEDTPLPENFTFPPHESKSIPMLIGPKATLGGSVIYKTAEELVSIQQRKKHFYIWGFAKYFDIFNNKKEHITKFCYKVSLNGDPTKPEKPGNVVAFTFDLHEQNNCADEGCNLN